MLKVAKKVALRNIRPELFEKEREDSKKDEVAGIPVKIKFVGKDTDNAATNTSASDTPATDKMNTSETTQSWKQSNW